MFKSMFSFCKIKWNIQAVSWKNNRKTFLAKPAENSVKRTQVISDWSKQFSVGKHFNYVCSGQLPSFAQHCQKQSRYM
jgi:hypothetical protein